MLLSTVHASPHPPTERVWVLADFPFTLNIFLSVKHFASQGPGKYDPDERFVRRTFCPHGRFVRRTFCRYGSFVPTDVLSPRMLCPRTFCLRMFCLQTFCLGTAKNVTLTVFVSLPQSLRDSEAKAKNSTCSNWATALNGIQIRISAWIRIRIRNVFRCIRTLKKLVVKNLVAQSL